MTGERTQHIRAEIAEVMALKGTARCDPIEGSLAFTAVCVVSLIFWIGVSAITGVEEPWDPDSYWTIIYPAGLALSALMGAMLTTSQWSAGAIVMFAQIPIIVAASGASALLA